MRWFGSAWLALTAAIAGAASFFSYQAGLAAGLATKLPAGAAPYPYGHYWGWGPGLGFFPFFGFVWFLLVLFIVFAVFRGFARGARRGWGGGGPGREERLREWHRQAHEQEPPTA